MRAVQVLLVLQLLIQFGFSLPGGEANSLMTNEISIMFGVQGLKYPIDKK